MIRKALILGLSLGILPLMASGQQGGAVAPVSLPLTTQQDVYCSGEVTTTHVPRGVQILSGEDALYKLTFSEGDYIYINAGSKKGVKPGDEFSVMRPVDNETGIWWFAAQSHLLGAMGQMWEDVGRVKVVVAHPDVSIAQVTHSCSYMQRGDIVQPFVERTIPQLKSEVNFDRFAPPSGKKKAMVVAGKAMQIESGTNDIVYVNLGSKQGVNVGDYFRIYRYQSNEGDMLYQTPNMGTEVYGYGSAPGGYSSKNLPRQILGEGIVLRTTPNSATVLITHSLEQIFAGDYCELE